MSTTFAPAKYEIEIYLDKVQADRREAAIEACKQTWSVTRSVAWNWSPPASDDPDSECILTGYGWVWDPPIDELVKKLHAAVLSANGRTCAVSIIFSQILNAGEQAVEFGPRGGQRRYELRGGKYVQLPARK